MFLICSILNTMHDLFFSEDDGVSGAQADSERDR
jgi:hypothetical protein